MTDDLVLTYITFGSAHTAEHDRLTGGLRLHDGYVVIEAPSRSEGREVAHAVFGPVWAFDYAENPATHQDASAAAVAPWYPLGELVRIAWQGDVGSTAAAAFA